jgi:hypothetical protein
MHRIYPLSVILLGTLTHCRDSTEAPAPESDRAALERAERVIGQKNPPSYELFARTIGDTRNRFGDMTADTLIDRMLALRSDYAPAHLARAESLFRHGQIEAAAAEVNLALRYSCETSSPAQLLAIHMLLAHTLSLPGISRGRALRALPALPGSQR